MNDCVTGSFAFTVGWICGVLSCAVVVLFMFFKKK